MPGISAEPVARHEVVMEYKAEYFNVPAFPVIQVENGTRHASTATVRRLIEQMKTKPAVENLKKRIHVDSVESYQHGYDGVGQVTIHGPDMLLLTFQRSVARGGRGGRGNQTPPPLITLCK
jgi:hypothetical protein